MNEQDLKQALARPAEPAPGFEARIAAGVHERWRRPLRWPFALALATTAAFALWVGGRKPVVRSAPVPPPAMQPGAPVDDGESLTDRLFELADVDEVLAVRADWDRALAPLAPYRDLADLGELP